MSPEDLQSQLGRSATVERELRDRIRDLEQTVSTQAESLRAAMGQVEEAKAAAARTCYERAIAVSKVLAKMQAENTRLQDEVTELRADLGTERTQRALAETENTRLSSRLALVEPIARRLAEHVVAIGTGDGQALQAFLMRRGQWAAHVAAVDAADLLPPPASDSTAPPQPVGVFQTAALAACAYLTAHAALVDVYMTPERPDAARRLGDAWIALTKACEEIQPAGGPAQPEKYPNLPPRPWTLSPSGKLGPLDVLKVLAANGRTVMSCAAGDACDTDLARWMVEHANAPLDVQAPQPVGGPAQNGAGGALPRSGIPQSQAAQQAGEAGGTAAPCNPGSTRSPATATGSELRQPSSQAAPEGSGYEPGAGLAIDRATGEESDLYAETPEAPAPAPEGCTGDADCEVCEPAPAQKSDGIPPIAHDYVPTAWSAVDACDARVSDPGSQIARQCGRPRKEHPAEEVKPEGRK